MRKEQVLIPLLRRIATNDRLSALLLGRDRWGNPFSPEALADPYADVDRMLADAPVAYRALYQQWFVLGYDEARELLTHPDVIGGGQIDTLLAVRPYSKLNDLSKGFFKTILPLTDPPVHPRLRALVGRAFTPKRIAGLEASVQDAVDELVADLPTEGPIDIRSAFTVPLPINVIAGMLGVPRERWGWVHQVTSELVKLLDPFEGFDPVVMDATIAEIHEVYTELAEERRRRPTDDLLTDLVAAQDDGDALSPEELSAMVATIMGAGFETTSGVLGTSLIALHERPDQRALLAERPELWPNAVEELLRYDTPVKVVGRQATADIDVAGRTIPTGANIIISLIMAHRDSRRYDDPFELRLDREDPRPLSFGHGPHHCLGAALARLEIRLGLQALLDSLGDYTIAVDEVGWRRSLTLRNQSQLTLTPG